jgi:hypothetical protein
MFRRMLSGREVEATTCASACSPHWVNFFGMPHLILVLCHLSSLLSSLINNNCSSGGVSIPFFRFIGFQIDLPGSMEHLGVSLD